MKANKKASTMGNQRISSLGVFALLCFINAASAWGQTNEANRQLVEAAKKEGKLVWYTTMQIDGSKPLLDAFMKEYPFIKAELVRIGGSTQLLTRIMTETRAGRWLFDVTQGSSMPLLVKSNLVSPYASPERESFINEFKDSQGFWTGMYVTNLVLMYNTNLVAARDIPKDYSDLLDPKWKGKMMMEPSDYDWYGTLMMTWGQNKAGDYMRQLARQDLTWRNGHGLIPRLVAAGERALGWAFNYRVEIMKKQGAPVDWVDTFNPILAEVNGIGLSAKPNNPNAAKLFINFALGRRGQGIVRDMQRVPARSDVKPVANKMDQSRLHLKAVPEEVVLNLDRYAQEFRKTFGL
jgi:iron(III) transport system substrate-binding protein